MMTCCFNGQAFSRTGVALPRPRRRPELIHQEIQPPRPLRILVAEDQPDTADALAMLLRLVGHHVQVARDGSSALTAAADLDPDVVLLDIELPDLDGHEVARRLASSVRGQRPV